MSHFSHAPWGLDGLQGLAVSRLPQLTSLLKQNHSAGGNSPAPTVVDAEHLRAAVSQVFGPADHILFDVSAASDQVLTDSRIGTHQMLRVDLAVGSGPPPASLKRLIAAIGLAKAKATLREDDWVVLVADETTLDLEQATDLLQQFEHLQRFLLIWCGPQSQNSAGDERHLAPSADLPPSATTIDQERTLPFDREGLIAALRRLKSQSSAAVLDLQLRQAFLATEFANGRTGVQPTAAAPPATSHEPRANAALEALLQLAEQDRRIVLVSLDARVPLAPLAARHADRYFEIPVADVDALAWCAGLAAGGCRPVICASERALAQSWPALAEEICRPQHAVKLVALPSNETTSALPSSLSMLRLLPDTPLLVPRDQVDLAAMLEFAVAYDGPAAVWCCEAALSVSKGEPALVESTRQHWQFGRAEVLGPAGAVALIGWGAAAAAAERAAAFLRTADIQPAIVNARFLQPLDREAIIAAARAAQVCLVLDDPRWQAGFAAEVLELLAHAGVTTPTSILPMSRRHGEIDVQQGRDDFAMRIADRCRWLAEPVRPEFRFHSTGSEPNGRRMPAQPVGWLQLFSPAPVDVPTDSPGPLPLIPPAQSIPPKTIARPAELLESDLAAEQRQIQAVEFSPELSGWIRDYEMVGNRNVYLWRWCLHGLRLTTLPCVDPALRASLCETKLLAVMLGVMLDDIADLGGNPQLLKLLNGVVVENKAVDLSDFDAEEQAYGQFTVRLSNETWGRLRQAPRYEQLADLLIYDHRQIVNAMEYSSLLNRDLALVNLVEHDAYSPHNMQMMSFATMDLMASRDFDRRELGRLRAVIWHAQSMGRIGNLLSTWQREVKVRDFTSGVFARALQQGDIELDDLQVLPSEAIEQVIGRGSHDDYFLDRWQFHRRAIEAILPRIRSVDLRPLLAGLKRLIAMELGSRGLK